MEVYGWLMDSTMKKPIDEISCFYVNERNILLVRFLSKGKFFLSVK